MVDLAELEAAIAAGFETLEHYIKELSGYEYNATANYFGEPERPPQLTTALAAFAAYREHIAALVAENARLRDALRPFAKTWANYQTDELGNREHKSFLFWLFYFSEMSNDYVDSAAAHAQAAALADVETKSTAGGEQ